MKFLVIFLLVCGSFAGDLPNPKLTPGRTNPKETAETLCAKGFTTKDERHVTDAQKKAVFAVYGITNPAQGEYEIDHLISLELGGSNENANLWPQSYLTKPWNAHVKDQLETRLHWLVCHGQLPLAQAQSEISADWIACYKKYVSPVSLAKLPSPKTSERK